MARHKPSKVNRVSVNPNSTIRYVTGILTSADKYIMGLLNGTGLYQTWAEVEGQLEGKPIPTYQQDQMRKFLSNPENMALARKAIYNPAGLTPSEATQLTSALTNYQRVAKVDEYMIDKGEEYKNEYYAEAYRSKNPQFGINLLESQGMMAGSIKDRVGNVISKLIYNY